MQDTGAVDIAIPDSSLVTEALDSLAGRWAMKVVQSGVFLPLNEEWDITLTDLVIVDVPSDSSGAYFLFCDQTNVVDTRQDPEHPMKPDSSLSQELKDAGINQVTLFEEVAIGMLPALDLLWFWGLNGLEDPAGDPLPDSPDSPYVWDEDGDGNPGVTIHVGAPIPGDRYMVRRGTWTLDEGTMSGDHLWIAGDLTFNIDERAIGATDDLLLTMAPIKAKEDGSEYVMRRVSPGFTCTDLVKQHSQVFEGAPGQL